MTQQLQWPNLYEQLLEVYQGNQVLELPRKSWIFFITKEKMDGVHLRLTQRRQNQRSSLQYTVLHSAGEPMKH